MLYRDLLVPNHSVNINLNLVAYPEGPYTLALWNYMSQKTILIMVFRGPTSRIVVYIEQDQLSAKLPLSSSGLTLSLRWGTKPLINKQNDDSSHNTRNTTS